MSFLTSLVPAFTRTAAPASVSNTDTQDAVPALKPHYTLAETAEGFQLTVLLPGVSKDTLEFSADDTTLSLVARKAWTAPVGWTTLYRETQDARYELQLAHDHVIELDNIKAELADGVLRVTLRKTEAVKPRKITVA